MPSTLATELTKLGFDWESGSAVYQEGGGLKPVKSARVVRPDDPILNERWQNGPSFAHLPRFIAKDKRGMYVAYKDGHGQGLRFVPSDFRVYLQSTLIPYPEDH